MVMRFSGTVCGALALGAALVLPACGGNNPPPKPPPGVETVKPVTTSAPNPTHTKRAVNVSDEIRGLCGLPEPKDAPKFDFDQADLSSEDRDVVEKVAKCMIDGPLKGRDVVLTGRADKRGEAEYNLALGAKRAEGVKKYMTGLGVADGRLNLTSRGELDAKGTDEETYRMDRRVDISLKK